MKTIHRLGAVLLAVVGSLTLLFHGHAAADPLPPSTNPPPTLHIGWPCPLDRPTFVGGTIYGYPDGRAVASTLGVVIGDGTRYYHPDGTVMSDPAPYSWVEQHNPGVGPDGTSDSTLPDGTPVTKTWGQCVTRKATKFWVEAGTIYRQPRYAPTAYYNGTLTPGQRLNLPLRLQLTYQAASADGTPALGNTGGVLGYVTHASTGTYIAASHLVINAFPGAGAACGIRGYAASADVLGTAANPWRTFYKLSYLVGGQCGATSQSYAMWVQCLAVCGAAKVIKVVTIRVTAGRWPRVDIRI